MTQKKQLAYLAAPYNHPDPIIRKERHFLVNCATAQLIQEGTFVFSPLTHNIPLFEVGLRAGWDIWEGYDFALIDRCDRLIVLQLEGWEDSHGVAAEIAYAQKEKIPIEYLDPSFIKNKVPTCG